MGSIANSRIVQWLELAIGRILLFVLKKAKWSCNVVWLQVRAHHVVLSVHLWLNLVCPFADGLSVGDQSIVLYCAQSLPARNRTKALNSSVAHKVRLPTGVLSFSGTVRRPILPLDKWLGKLVGNFPEHSPPLYKDNQLASTGLPGRAPMFKRQAPISIDVRY